MNETFAPFIRKQMLQALDEHIIPALQARQALQVLAGPPFDFGAAEHWPVRKGYLPDETLEPLQLTQRWQNAGMVANRWPFIGFVYSGVADDIIGVTKAQAKAVASKNNPAPAGITAVRLPAPAVISILPGIAHRGGTAYHEPSRPGGGPSAILWLDIMADAVLPHICSTMDEIISSHLLRIDDPLLAQMARIYLDELQHPRSEKDAAQAQFLALMCRMRRVLASQPVQLANSCWDAASQIQIPTTSVAGRREQVVCRVVMEYIETHLNTPLTLEVLAQEAGVSTAHLCRVFHRTSGVTLMHYVTQRRIEAAKRILEFQPERISDVAKLVGFASSSSFSTVFNRIVGCSPRDYARRNTRDT